MTEKQYTAVRRLVVPGFRSRRGNKRTDLQLVAPIVSVIFVDIANPENQSARQESDPIPQESKRIT